MRIRPKPIFICSWLGAYIMPDVGQMKRKRWTTRWRMLTQWKERNMITLSEIQKILLSTTNITLSARKLELETTAGTANYSYTRIQCFQLIKTSWPVFSAGRIFLPPSEVKSWFFDVPLTEICFTEDTALFLELQYSSQYNCYGIQFYWTESCFFLSNEDMMWCSIGEACQVLFRSQQTIEWMGFLGNNFSYRSPFIYTGNYI